MIKTIKRTSAIIMMAILMLSSYFAFNTFESNAATFYISCPGSVTQGQTFTATVVYSGDTYGVVVGSWSYDSSKFSLVSGSTSYSLYSDSGVSSLSASITLVANSAGAGSVTANTTSASNYDMQPLAFGSTSVGVTVVAPAAPSGGSSGSSGGSSASKKKAKDDPQAEKEEAKKDEDKDKDKKKNEKPAVIEVEIAGAKYAIVEKFDKVPNGFKKATFKYGEHKWDVAGVVSKDGKYKMLKVKKSDTGEKTWFFYDEASSMLSPTTTIAASELMEAYGNEGVEQTDYTKYIIYGAMGIIILVLAILLIVSGNKNKKLKQKALSNGVESEVILGQEKADDKKARKEINTKNYQSKH